MFCGLHAGDTTKNCSDCHADACGIALAQHVACHDFACGVEIFSRLSICHHHSGIVSNFDAEIGKRNAGADRVSIKRCRFDLLCPVGFLNRQSFGGVAILLIGVEGFATNYRSIEFFDGARKYCRIELQFFGKLWQS